MLADTPILCPSEGISPKNAQQVVELARWGRGKYQVVWSPDGQRLAVASSDGVHLHDPQTLTGKGFLKTNAQVTCMVFSPDGDVLATVSGDSTVFWGIPP